MTSMKPWSFPWSSTFTLQTPANHEGDFTLWRWCRAIGPASTISCTFTRNFWSCIWNFPNYLFKIMSLIKTLFSPYSLFHSSLEVSHFTLSHFYKVTLTNEGNKILLRVAFHQTFFLFCALLKIEKTRKISYYTTPQAFWNYTLNWLLRWGSIRVRGGGRGRNFVHNAGHFLYTRPFNPHNNFPLFYWGKELKLRVVK